LPGMKAPLARSVNDAFKRLSTAVSR